MKKVIFFILFLPSLTSSQWVVDFDPYKTTPYYINVVDTGTIWCLGYTSGWWDTVEVMTKTPEYGWQWGNGNDLPTNVQYFCIAGINSSTAFVGDRLGHIYKTTNYGWNWSLILNAGNNYLVTDIKFSKVERNVGYIFCSRNDYVADVFKIYKTTDYGGTWQMFTPYFGNNIISNKPEVWVTDSEHAWIGLSCLSQNCPYVQIAYTTNGGVNWLISNVESGRSSIESVAFSYDNQFGIATSYKLWTPNNLLISTNGGVNWSFQDTIPMGNVLSLITIPETSVWYLNSLVLYPDTTRKPFVYKSSNNGLNWFHMTPVDSNEWITDVDAIKLNDKIYGWAAGEGRVLRLIDTPSVIGINNNGNIIPNQFHLEQNFPNPFNPTTSINFSIPEAGYTTIMIYNILGKLVCTLVEQNLAPGRYTVDWNAAKMPSGIYVYRIESGSFTQSRKMILIK